MKSDKDYENFKKSLVGIYARAIDAICKHEEDGDDKYLDGFLEGFFNRLQENYDAEKNEKL